jgi:hypothetical protein
MNGGSTTPLNATGGVTVRYVDQEVRIAGAMRTTSLKGTVASIDGSGWAGTVSEDVTEHLSSESPATVVAREVVDTSSLVATGSTHTTIRLATMYDFGAMPEPLFFDRTDLDTIAIGFSESVDVLAPATATETITTTSAPETSNSNESVNRSLSWSLLAVLPTLQVLGKDYTDVVQVAATMTSTTTAGDAPQTSSTLWLAKGIGIVRAQVMGRVASGVDENDTFELASTNLVAP